MDENELRSPLLRAFGLLITLLGIAPALVLLRAPLGEGWRTLAPLGLSLLCFPISLMPRKRRLLALIPLCLACGACAYAAARYDAGVGRFAYIGICLAAPAYALPSIYRYRLHVEISVGIIAALASWVFLRNPANAAARREVFWLAAALLPTTLIYANLAQLEREGRAQKSGRMDGMRPANIALVCALIALAFLLASARTIWQWLKSAGEFVLRLIMKLFTAPLEQIQQSEDGAASEGEMVIALGDMGERSPLWEALEKVAIALALVLVVVALIVVIKRLPAMLRRLGKALRALLKRYFKAITAEGCDYTDTNESLNVREARLKGAKRRRRLRAPRWDELDNRRKVRAAYRLAVADSAKPNRSASENLTEALGASSAAARELSRSYDRARYSGHEISDAEADAARGIAAPSK